MCKHLRKRGAVSLYSMISIFTLFLFSYNMSNAQAVACNDNIQISLDENCEAEITPDLILEGSGVINPADYEVTISGTTGVILTTPGSYTATVTYLPTGNNCWGNIKVEDKLAPQFADPADPIFATQCPCAVGNTDPACQFLCTDLSGILDNTVVTPTPAPVENCGGMTSETFDVVTDGVACGEKIVTRTWIFTDASGNTSDACVQEFTLSPIDVDTDVTAPVNIVNLTCGAGSSPQEINDFFLPTLGAAVAATHAWPTVDGTPITSQLCNVVVTKADQTFDVCEPGCSGNFKVIRTWTVLDWCGGTTKTFVQIIKASDEVGPTVEADNVTVTVDPWGCQGNFLMPVPTLLHDNCADVVNYFVTGPAGVTITVDASTGQYFVFGAPKGDHTFTYTGSDCCGNTTSTDVTVSVVDKTAPVASALQNIVVSLTNGVTTGNGVGKIFASSVDNGSYDGCGPVHLEIRREADACGVIGNTTYNNDGHLNDANEDTDNGEFVKFCCADLTDIDENGTPFGLVQVWMRVWDDGDMDGVYGSAGDNYNETWATVRVEDKLAPAILCPADVTVDCDANISDLGTAVAYSTCGNPTVLYTDSGSVDGCGVGVITRKWYVKSRPDIFCTQEITKIAVAPFNGSITWPADEEATCVDLPGAPQSPIWVSGVCDQIAYSVKSDTFLFEDGACFKILNDYTVIDWCQYDPNAAAPVGIWSHTTVIKVIDNDAPEILNCAPAMFAVNGPTTGGSSSNTTTCYATDVTLTNAAVDLGDCASAWLKWTVAVDIWGDNTVDYTFTTNTTVNSPFYLAPTTSGQDVSITIPENIEGSMYNHKVTWSVTDGCGNVTSCNSTFMVVDKKAPTPYCINLSTALMQNGMVELWACDFDLGSFDNCTATDDLRFTFSNVAPENDPNYLPSTKCSAITFDCDDLPTDPADRIEVEVYVWDEKGNFDFCTVLLTLLDNQGGCNDPASRAAISGSVKTATGDEIEGVNVQLVTNLPWYPIAEMTANDGAYAFGSNPMYLDYDITGSKDIEDMNGVSTLDLVIIQKHILGLQGLNSPYKLIAADINSDENVSAIDLIELRKLILGIYDELPNNESWRFVGADYTFADDNDPFPFTENIDVNSLASDMMNEQLIGIKVGDVNNSAVANATSGEAFSNRNNKTITFETLDQEVVEGELVEVAITSSNFDNLLGFQYTMTVDGIELEDITSGALDMKEHNFGSISSTNLTSSWNEVSSVSVSPKETLFTLAFTARTSGMLSEMLQITSTVTAAEAYDDNLQTSQLELTYRNEEGAGFQLFQNAPNPFNDITTIGFTLPSAASASLTVYDVTGKVLYRNTANYEKGFNQIQLSNNDLDSRGLMYYQLESGTNIATKKMIEIE